MPSSLCVSIVVYRPDMALLGASLRSLGIALANAHGQAALAHCEVVVVDNDAAAAGAAPVQSALATALDDRGGWLTHQLIESPGNVGYGAANNLAISASRADYHLVMNPDVVLDPDAISAALAFMEHAPHVALLSPLAADPEGARQYLCKRYPSLWVLFLRGFGPRALQRLFAHDLARYEMRDETADGYAGRFLASGCFMLMRRDVLRKVGGFDPGFFMYFEDYDLSMRIARHAELAFVPAVRIVHYGGNAAGKGWRHRRLFLRSALRFFHVHGWRLV